MKPYRNILCPTDFSPSARQALDVAVTLARRLDAHLHVVHVLALAADDRVTAEELMPREVPDTFDDVVVGREMVRALKPELGILRAAREKDVDLIVLGTHGRSGLTHALLGSVAERVVQLAGCPVLTVRPDGMVFEHPHHTS